MMKKTYPTYQLKARNVHELPVYKKALELFALCREVAHVVTNEKSILELGRSKERIEKITGHMISTALGLAPRIAMVESTKDPLVRLDSLRAIQHATGSLATYCDHIENKRDIENTFLQKLRAEIDMFRKLQSRWAGRLCELN